jgi:cell division control protein 45
MTEETYNFFHTYMKSHMARTNGEDPGRKTVVSSDGTVLVGVSEDGGLSAEHELRFAHFRHWSLYDSMYFSPFVSTRLQVWQAPGKAKLHELYAKLGVSLDECKQKWAFVSPKTSARVLGRIDDYADEFGLQGLRYAAFQRTVGFSAKTSALDVVHAAHALLEHATAADALLEGPAAAAAGADDAGAAAALEAHVGEWASSFWAAYDVVLGKDPVLLAKGVALSTEVQRGVVERAVGLVEKKALTGTKHFRWALLPRSASSSSASDGLFAQPLALTKLALYLVEMHRANKKWAGAKARPLILLAERSRSCLVVGVTCPDLKGNAKNFFGKAFASAAAHCGAAVTQASFETGVLEIDRENVRRFIESLHFTMDL